MSKRSTTGLPKPGQPKPQAEAPKGRLQPKLIREYRSKAEREAEMQRLIILGTAVAVGVALLVLIVAVLNDQLLVPGQSVATVNNDNITVREFKSRAKLERALLISQLNNALQLYSSIGYTSDQLAQLISSQAPYSTWYNELTIADQLGNSVVNSMVDDELVRQKADELGITVSEDEVDAKIADFFGYDPAAYAAEPTATPSPTASKTPLVSPTPSPSPTASPTPDQTATPTLTPFPTATASATPDATQRADQFSTSRSDYFASIRSQTGLSDADIRDYFRMQALRDKVRDAVITDVSRSAPYVNARHILVDTEDEANDVLAALQNGESFAALAKAVSNDGSSTSGGELGWQGVDQYVTEFADAVRDAEIGALVGPVQSQYGYHIVQVRAREDRELTDDQYNQLLNTKFAQYLKDLRAADTTHVEVHDVWTDNVPLEPVFIPAI